MGGQPDINKLMQQAEKMQAEMMAAQSQLEETTVEGSAGGGKIRAIVSGTGKLQALTIAPEIIDPDDAEMLQDLIVVAVQDAERAANELQDANFSSITGDLL